MDFFNFGQRKKYVEYDGAKYWIPEKGSSIKVLLAAKIQWQQSSVKQKLAERLIKIEPYLELFETSSNLKTFLKEHEMRITRHHCNSDIPKKHITVTFKNIGVYSALYIEPQDRHQKALFGLDGQDIWTNKIIPGPWIENIEPLEKIIQVALDLKANRDHLRFEQHVSTS